MTIVHLPVLGREVIEVLAPQRGGTYIDATVGLGGHSEMILDMIGQNGQVVGIDRDDEALKKAAVRLKDSRIILKKGAFSGMEAILHDAGIREADGVLFDLGVSMMQIRDLGRGFSFHSDERLDMRMDSSQPLTAWDVTNTYPERELERILKEYGEEPRARRVAGAIVRQRQKKSIDTCSELGELVSRTLGRGGRIHPATRSFQALRIEVNRELDELKGGLEASVRMLRKGGRLCVISYHSLEDRIVKNFIRDKAKSGIVAPLVKKPLVPSQEERRMNPSSRSAKLRGAERL